MTQIELITKLLHSKQLLIGMVAPSFPVMYMYPHIIGKIRRLGFDKVVEVTVGAAKTNSDLIKAFTDNPKARYITSPCPSVVRLIQKKYPELSTYVMIKTDSPMIATSKLMKEKYSHHIPVFIGPCFAKKTEAKDDPSALGIVVITYVELEALFQTFSIHDDISDSHAVFDMEELSTRSYPTDGALTQTSNIRSILKDEEIRIVSGWKNCDVALHEFATNSSIRLLDILFCDGGCISGPGIASPLSVEERRQRIMAFHTRG